MLLLLGIGFDKGGQLGSDKFMIKYKYGKEIDIKRLKSKVDFQREIKLCKSSSTKIYKLGNLQKNKCFICKSSLYKEIIEIYKFTYVQCKKCSHVYLLYSPPKIILDNYYKSQNYTNMAKRLYLDKKIANYRVKNIGGPKISYVENFISQRGIWLDIGAGSGEIVYAAQKRGWESLGLEVNKSSREFGIKNYKIEILNKNFNDLSKDFFKNVKVISLFGVLEHLYGPLEFLKEINKKINSGAIIVVSIPHFNSLSTLCQILHPGKVARHLLPPNHLMAFTEDSVKKIFNLSGFKIMGMWFLGLDFYEFINCFFLNKKLCKFLLKNINEFQGEIDSSRLSDEIIVVSKKI